MKETNTYFEQYTLKSFQFSKSYGLSINDNIQIISNIKCIAKFLPETFKFMTIFFSNFNFFFYFKVISIKQKN